MTRARCDDHAFALSTASTASRRLSRRAHDQLDHVHVLSPARGLLAEPAAASSRELVVLRGAILIGRLPLALDPPLLLPPLQRRIEGSLPDLERILRELFEPLGYPPAVHRRERKCLEDQQVQGSADDVLGGGMTGHRW